MPCFLCKKTSHYYQRLRGSRLRYMQKGYPNFESSDYLCLSCFDKFERIYQRKKKPSRSSELISTKGTIDSLSSEPTSKTNDTNKTSEAKTASGESPLLQFRSNITMESSGNTSDLVDVQPVVKRRREPVVYFNQDIMDVYLANTSGG